MDILALVTRQLGMRLDLGSACMRLDRVFSLARDTDVHMLNANKSIDTLTYLPSLPARRLDVWKTEY